ncbi:MAG: hypothetical protein ABII64_07855 [Elusimicrobiota bacterium]
MGKPVYSGPSRGKTAGGPSALTYFELLALSCRSFLLLIKTKNTISEVLAGLNRLKPVFDFARNDINALIKRIDAVYFLSPWFWRRKCLYKSLLLYYALSGKKVFNIGLEIRHNFLRSGHCWVTVDGSPADESDNSFIPYYSDLFAKTEDIWYWLPSMIKGNPDLAEIFKNKS